MFKKIALSIIVFISMVLICYTVAAKPYKYINPIEISGKILDKDGKPFTENVEIEISVSIDTVDYAAPNGHQNQYENKKYIIPAQEGIFSWKGEGTDLTVEAIKEGYHSMMVDLNPVGRGQTLKSNDILIYLIPKGTPSKLEFVEGAEIPSKNRKESGGKQCGWSFKKLWYFPVDGDEPVDMVRGANENKKRTYTMKEPGGFVFFTGYPSFESSPNKRTVDRDMKVMTEAPESGYIPTFTPAEHEANDRGEQYCYFKTPGGKYGKICFSGDFSYYLQPDGSRNLEAGEVKTVGPVNPSYKKWLDEWAR